MTNFDYEVLLTDAELARLNERVASCGVGRTADSLKLSRMTLLHILARQPARRGSVAMVRIGLGKAI